MKNVFFFFFFSIFHASIGTCNFHKPSLLVGTSWHFLTTEIVTLVSVDEKLIWLRISSYYMDRSIKWISNIHPDLYSSSTENTHTFITTLWRWMFSNAHFHLMIFYFCTIKISRWKRMKTMKFTKKKTWKNKGYGKEMKRYTKQACM